MFVQYLNEKQQAALLHYAREIMVADNAIDAEESLHMEVLHTQVRSGVQSEAIPIHQLCDLFSDRPSQVILLLELIGMGYADEEFDVRESELVNKIARAFSVAETGTLDNIESWVRRQLLLLKEAQELMGG